MQVEPKINRTLKDERNVTMKTKSKIIMECAAENVEVRNGNSEDLKKMNKVRKNKKIFCHAS